MSRGNLQNVSTTPSQRRWYEDNREHVRERTAKYYLANKEAFKDRKLRFSYGIGLADYNELLEKQGGGCAICGGPPRGGRSKKYFHVDHDHVTGKVRGLLCHYCNTAIGSLQENPERLEKAIEYLRS